MLTIGDQAIPPDQLHQYVIRFCQTAEGPVPVLYFQGKRVTQAWRIELTAEIAEDEFGGNANTA
jgi:hypothetical protein